MNRSKSWIILSFLAAGCGTPDGTNNEQANNDSAASDYSYHQDVKPIVDAHCGTCHVPDGLGPFPLTTYDEVSSVASLVANAVTSRSMPPFAAAPPVRPLAYDTSLSDEQINVITTWAEGGAPEGDPESPGEPISLELDSLTSADLTLTMSEPFEPSSQDGTDVYRCFVIDWPETQVKFINGFQMRPGNLKIDHHAVAYLIDPDQVSTVEEADSETADPGYDCFGGPTPSGAEDLPAKFVAAWTPGAGALTFPEGSGMRIVPGSKLVLQMHYNLLEAEPGEIDQTEFEFQLSDEVDEIGGNMPWLDVNWLSGDGMLIPAGDASVAHEFTADPTTYPLLGAFVPGLNPSEGVYIHSVLPHLHKLGRKFTVEVDRANGETEQLLHIDAWDFDWQRFYKFAEPVLVNPGDELRIRCEWDNTSMAQPLIEGQRVTPSDVTWGENSLDEMCVAAMYVTGVASGSTECADVGSIASDTGRFEITFDTTVRNSSNLEGEMIGPVFGSIFHADDVTVAGPKDGAEAVASLNFDEIDLREGTDGPYLIDVELPAGDYQFLGWMDTDGNADPDAPQPDTYDPVMIPANAKTLACETQPATALFAILKPDF